MRAINETSIEIARALGRFLAAHQNKFEAFGTEHTPSEPVRMFQIAVGITRDGIAGSDTYRAAQECGVSFPRRPVTPVTPGGYTSFLGDPPPPAKPPLGPKPEWLWREHRVQELLQAIEKQYGNISPNYNLIVEWASETVEHACWLRTAKK